MVRSQVWVLLSNPTCQRSRGRVRSVYSVKVKVRDLFIEPISLLITVDHRFFACHLTDYSFRHVSQFSIDTTHSAISKPMSLVSGALLFAAACVVIVSLVSRARADASSTRLPPGPKGWPVVGNLFDIPHSKPWETYLQWSKCYGQFLHSTQSCISFKAGPVVHMSVLGRHIVVLNTAKAVSDLLETRSSVYSDRIRFIMISL